MSESFKRKRKEYWARLHSLKAKELEVFITEAKLDNKLDIITNPQNKKELEMAKAHLSIFNDELIIQKIINNKTNIIKPEENLFLKLLINIYNNEKQEKFLLLNKVKLGKIKAHSMFMQGYEKELEEYLNKLNINDFKLLLKSESQMLKILDITFLNHKNIKKYAKGYHQTLLEIQNNIG